MAEQYEADKKKYSKEDEQIRSTLRDKIKEIDVMRKERIESLRMLDIANEEI